MRLPWLVGLVALSLSAADVSCFKCTQNNITALNSSDSGKGVEGAAPPLPPALRTPPPPPPARPQPQPANDELWTKCTNKGCTLASAMQASDKVAGAAYSPPRDTAQSPFRSQDDLRKWFWSPFPEDKIDEKIHDFYGTWGVGWALVDLGINPYSSEYDGGKNELFFIDHESFHPQAPSVDEQRYMVDNKEYRATGASYAFTVNSDEGVIMGLNRKSPRYAGEERTPKVSADQLPSLNQFSDVAWIGWDSISKRKGSDVKNLRYFISVGINNEDTKAVILRALNARQWALDEWPGHVFEKDTVGFSALLGKPLHRRILTFMCKTSRLTFVGTPNLQGFAYFLVQHKDRLGNMYIDRLQVFHGETPHKNPCVVMHVAQPRPPGLRREGKKEVVRTHVVRAKL